MAFLTHGFLVSCIRRDSTKYSAKATAKLKYENANEGIYWVWWQTAKNMSSKSKIRRKVKDFEQEKKRTKWMALVCTNIHIHTYVKKHLSRCYSLYVNCFSLGMACAWLKCAKATNKRIYWFWIASILLVAGFDARS